MAPFLILGLALVGLASGCGAAGLREARTPAPAGTPSAVPWALNRELLQAAPGQRQILFVVELAEGHPPDTDALDDLCRLAARYGERPAHWTVLGGPEAPNLGALDSPLPHPPPLRGGNSRVGPLAADTSYVFVRYVGEQLPKWGLSYTRYVNGRRIYVIMINQERHRRFRPLLPERRLEEQTLVHEYGHLLGLPTVDHGYYPFFPSFADGMHCVNPDCALSKVRLRSVLYNIARVAFQRRYLEDYCAECRRAIAAAKRYWKMGKRIS